MKDFKKLKPRKRSESTIDPYDIFRKNVSKMSASGINDLWAGQRDALREWHECRSKNDVALVLNTGAGKTLIGLLIGQSLVNETKGKVFYLCGSIQLIEQTREKAELYGIDVTTYHSRQFSNNLFIQGKSICVTTYQALFNGKSKFRNDEIEAIIFDDSHAAENLVKSCFSLDINRQENQEAFDQLAKVFRPYYQRIGKQASFDEILTGQNQRVELFPPFEVGNNSSEIRSILESNGVAEKLETLFSWNYLKDHLDLCGYFVSSGSIQITPPFIPVDSSPYFSTSIRRIYLTATLLGKDNFIRTFGREPDNIIVPETPAGECERQIIFPLLAKNVSDDRTSTQSLVENRKALIITPNYYIANLWGEIGSIPDSKALHEEINIFKESKGNDKIVITARYDGIDLPGDTCRVLVMDGIPMGASLIDKYHWEILKLSNTLRSLIACRVIQSLGRISRGMSDYGVVIVCDKGYVEWLQNARNQAFLPSFIQKQLQLGVELSEDSTGTDDLIETMDACLKRSENWMEAYETFMDGCETESNSDDEDLLVSLALAESNFINRYWVRDYARAAKKLVKVIDDAERVNKGLAAWYACWIAYCCEKSGDHETASAYYIKANKLTRETPRYIHRDINSTDIPFTDQVLNVSNHLLISARSQIETPKRMAAELKYLDGTGSVNKIEQSLMDLGRYLGFESSRPDNEHSIGPDVLWIDSSIAFAIEAKTDKDADYKKDEVGQLLNHIEWVKDNYPDIQNVTPLFVGPVRKATKNSSPSEIIMVCELEQFCSLGEKALRAYDDISNRAMPISLNQDVSDVFEQRELTMQKIIGGLSLTQLKGLI